MMDKIVSFKILRLSVITFLFMVFFMLVPSPCFAARYKTFSTVGMIITRENDGQDEILLQERKNTKWMDGFWDLASGGHVEKGETLKQAAVRETKEEVGLDIKEENLEFVGLNHNKIEEMGIYYCVYFKVKEFSGTPTVGEPDKCETIKWFPINDLPQNIIPIRKVAIENYLNNVLYDECGWQNDSDKV